MTRPPTASPLLQSALSALGWVPLLSWDSSACAPPPTFRPGVHSREPGPAPFGRTVPPARSCSVFAVSHRPDGLLRLAAAGLLHPAAGLGFAAFHALRRQRGRSHPGGRARSPRRVIPLEEYPSSAAVPRHRGRCPLAVSARFTRRIGPDGCTVVRPLPAASAEATASDVRRALVHRAVASVPVEIQPKCRLLGSLGLALDRLPSSCLGRPPKRLPSTWPQAAHTVPGGAFDRHRGIGFWQLPREGASTSPLHPLPPPPGRW
jgi:hypothetical protein